MTVVLDNLSAIIPQKPPFVMVDQLVSCNETTSVTNFMVTADNVLVEDGYLSEAGIAENIAQTAAAGMGYVNKKENRPILIGYIAAIKNLEVFAMPKVGEQVETSVVITNNVCDMIVVEGIMKCCSGVIAKCEMKIYVKN